ncbi:MAG TPA: DUF475 domain-containing protein [Candidatus Limnocylindrales bacterium]|nr:DUF475 domain-containing protein [Candidatus Limnocylindrales bacterium]
MAKKDRALKHYYLAFVVTGLVLLLSGILAGPSALLPIIALALIEVTFSFENAVLNSQVLTGMNKLWRTIFLTVGIAVAVFGVRLVLPLVMVSSTTGDSLGHVLQLALHQPEEYAEALHHAYPVIAAFGGVFLLMIGLRFFGEKKDVLWWNKVEAPLADFNQPWWFSISGALLAVVFIYLFLANGDSRVVVAAVLGGITFMVIKFMSELLLRNQEKDLKSKRSHSSSFMQFLYLELLDASFSFDGVIAAFAITKDVILIAAGLGIGAIYVRSMTMHLLERGTLTHYRYLIHGAHYAILSLSILLILSIRFQIPEVFTGLLGLVIIGFSIYNSRQQNNESA